MRARHLLDSCVLASAMRFGPIALRTDMHPKSWWGPRIARYLGPAFEPPKPSPIEPQERTAAHA